MPPPALTPTPRKRPPKPPGPGRTGRPTADPAGAGVRCYVRLTPTVVAGLVRRHGSIYAALKALAEADHARHPPPGR